MNITIVGSGYVGLVTGACFASLGHTVTCFDIDESRIRGIQEENYPFYEPNLEETLLLYKKNILFTASSDKAFENPECIFICVGTPSTESGEPDLSFLEKALSTLVSSLTKPALLVIKSTIPLFAFYKIKEFCAKKLSFPLSIVVNPEFLRQGSAVYDFLHPDRVVIGAEEKSCLVLEELYASFVDKERIFVMDIASAIMVKYTSNAFLATKISFANEISKICEKQQANVTEVMRAVGADKRIGNEFLNAGLGYGGSCFPKDLKALQQIASKNSVQTPLLEAVQAVNDLQIQHFLNKIFSHFSSVSDKRFVVWGLSFKPDTSDMREAPSIKIIQALLKEKAKIRVYDAEAMPTAEKIFGDRVEYYTNKYSMLSCCDALLILTEWEEFSKIDYSVLDELMNSPVIFDGRNVLDKQECLKHDITLFQIGK